MNMVLNAMNKCWFLGSTESIPDLGSLYSLNYLLISLIGNGDVDSNSHQLVALDISYLANGPNTYTITMRTKNPPQEPNPPLY
jgi:hypothetical protein